jgi:hypothetical protein
MTNWLIRGSRSGGYKWPERHLGQRGADWASKWAGSADLVRPAWAHFGSVRGLLCPVLLPESSRSFPLLHVGPCCQFLFGLDEAPCPARFRHFSDWVLGVFHLLGLGPCALGVVFTWLLDFYRASRSCHEVLDELIPEVLLSTRKPCINIKLQNRHARTNLLYQGV